MQDKIMLNENLMSTKENQIATHHLVLAAIDDLAQQLQDIRNYLCVSYKNGVLQ